MPTPRHGQPAATAGVRSTTHLASGGMWACRPTPTAGKRTGPPNPGAKRYPVPGGHLGRPYGEAGRGAVARAVFSFFILYSARKRKAILRRSRKTDTNPGGKTGRSDEVFRNRHISLHWPARCDTLDTGRGPAYDPVNPARDFGGFRACSQPRITKDFFGYSFTEVEVCGRMLA